MRGRSIHRSLTAAVALLSGALSAGVVRAGEIDVFSDYDPPQQAATLAPTRADPTSMDALFDDAQSAKAPLTIERADWVPEPAAKAAVETKKRSIAKTVTEKPVESTSSAGKIMRDKVATKTAVGARDAIDLDPEPDAKVTVPKAAPSDDPLDKPKAQKPTEAAKPGDPVKSGEPAKDQAATPADQPLPPLKAAIKAALDKRDADPKGTRVGERRKEREAIAFFYAAHGFMPTWSDNGKAAASVDSILARLARADEDALALPATPKALKTDGTPAEIAESDIALTEAVVAYARQASGARVDPRGISPLIGAKPALADPAELIDALALAGASAGDRLHELNPVDPRYVALRGKLAEMRGAKKSESDAKPIPAGPTLKLGMHDARVPLIRARLALDAPPADADADEYDSEIADAVADFQRVNGLPASGIFTKKTLAAMSGGPETSSPKLEGAIVANMEMWRWMPRDLGSDRIEVNVPAYLVTVFHDNEPVATNRVVVGKTDTPTPLFSNTMKYLIVNPLWNVPQSIIQKEMLPKGNGDLSYLQGRGYNVSYKHGQVTVQQESGAKNALGRIKFMFPNDFSVYLHDTPSKNFFQASRRAFSHGCVRVDKPFEFAESVLNDGVPEGGKILWSQARLQKMLGDKERYVYLPKPLPIHISYFTASVDPDSGQLQTREDIYGYTHAVASALGKESDAPPPRVAEKKPAPDRKPKRVADSYPRQAAEVPLPDEDTQAPRSTGSTGGGLFGWFGR